MAQPALSQLAVDLAPGQWIPVRQGPQPDRGRTALTLASTPTRWPGLIMAVDRVDPLHVAITIRIADPSGTHSEHTRTLTCGSRVAVLTGHHAVCRCCGQLAPCPSEHLERTIEDAMRVDLAAVVDGTAPGHDR